MITLRCSSHLLFFISLTYLILQKCKYTLNYNKCYNNNWNYTFHIYIYRYIIVAPWTINSPSQKAGARISRCSQHERLWVARGDGCVRAPQAHTQIAWHPDNQRVISLSSWRRIWFHLASMIEINLRTWCYDERRLVSIVCFNFCFVAI